MSKKLDDLIPFCINVTELGSIERSRIIEKLERVGAGYIATPKQYGSRYIGVDFTGDLCCFDSLCEYQNRSSHTSVTTEVNKDSLDTFLGLTPTEDKEGVSNDTLLSPIIVELSKEQGLYIFVLEGGVIQINWMEVDYIISDVKDLDTFVEAYRALSTLRKDTGGKDE